MGTRADKKNEPESRRVIGGERFLSLGRWFKRHVGRRVWKLSIDAGFTCPNIDGTVSTGGCAYCNNASFAIARRMAGTPIAEQIAGQRQRAMARGKADAFLVYFQANTNTYAPVDRLKKLYDDALAVSDDIIGLAIGTRPDCVSDDVLDLLAGYASSGKHIWLEFGFQTARDDIRSALNCGYTAADFDDAVSRARDRKIFICAHVIFGLPGETPDDMMRTVDHVAGSGIDGIKFHHLHIVKNTRLAVDYQKRPFPLPEPAEYVTWVVDALERLPATVAVQRLSADALGDTLIAPVWNLSSQAIRTRVIRELERRDSYQGASIGR